MRMLGFVHLHQRLLVLHRQDVVWRVLRRFGYDSSLTLAANYLSLECA